MNLEDIRKKVELDPETKGLQLSNADLLVVNKYLKIRDEIIDGYKPVLKTEPYIEIVYVETEEKRNLKIHNEIKNNLKIFESDIYLQDASFEQFAVYNEERKKVKELAQQFINNYSKTNYVKGLYLYGQYKSGKTYVLSMIAKELAKNNVYVLLVFMPDLVRTIKQGINDGDLEKKINILKQAEVLMLDDIGGENYSPWFRDEILLPILQYRLSAMLPTFFSSNLSYVELSKMLTNDNQEQVKGSRVIRRIRDLAEYVKLSEETYPK